MLIVDANRRTGGVRSRCRSCRAAACNAPAARTSTRTCDIDVTSRNLAGIDVAFRAACEITTRASRYIDDALALGSFAASVKTQCTPLDTVRRVIPGGRTRA